MAHNVYVIGVGMVPFQKPGASDDYPLLAAGAIRQALADAGLEYPAIEQVFVGYVYGDSTAGQRAVYEVGQTGVPIVNVNNNCATGSTALWLSRQAVLGGLADVVLAVGFEQMEKGAIGAKFTDRPNPLDPHARVMVGLQGFENAPVAAQMFGGAGREYRAKYGTRAETFAQISVKARRHAQNNPRALFRTPLTLDEVLQSPMVFDPLTRFQCCPPTCGAAAAVVASEAFVKRHGASRPIRIVAQALTTDPPTAFEPASMIHMVGYDMTRAAARRVYEAAAVAPEDIDVVELHDCFTSNELLSYEALGLCPEGEAERFIVDGQNTYGGQVVTNPSGGLLSKGHPLGATGLAQCTELVEQLRGVAGPRQVEGARLALQHNIGLGGACVVTLYARD